MFQHIRAIIEATVKIEFRQGYKKRWLSFWLVVFAFGEASQLAFLLLLTASTADLGVAQFIPFSLAILTYFIGRYLANSQQVKEAAGVSLIFLFIATTIDLLASGLWSFGLIAILVNTIFVNLLVRKRGRFAYISLTLISFIILALVNPVDFVIYDRLFTFLVPTAIFLVLNLALALFLEELRMQEDQLSNQLTDSQKETGRLTHDYEALQEKYGQLKIEVEKNDQLFKRFEYHLEQVMAERELVEDALTQSEARFRKLVENSSDIVLILDAAGYVIYCSESIQKTLGYDTDDLLGERILTRIHPADLQAADERFQRVQQWHELGQIEFRIQNAYGQWVYLEAIASNLLDNPAIAGIVVNLRDTTARNKTEKRLRLFESAVTNTTDAVMLVEGFNKPKITYVNQAFVQIMGYEPAEVLGRSPAILLDQEHGSLENKQFLKALQTHSATELEVINIKKNGSTVWISESMTPIFTRDGTFSHWVSIKRDISQRKELEEQFLQSQKMEAVGRLAGGIAHDFNNLLTVMLSYSNLLSRMPLEKKQRKYIAMIQDASEQAAELTQQLLAFSRKQYQERTLLDLNEVIADMKRLLDRLIGENIQIKLNLQKEIYPIEANVNQLKQVIMNLVVNARDAMPNGGEILIHTATVQLYDHYQDGLANLSKGQYVTLSIKDSGGGIDQQVLPHIFEPFFTTKAERKGTGLGLSTVYGIVTNSGGDIQVHSNIDEGTIFTIYLPKSDRLHEEVTAALPLNHIRTVDNETILLVEDNEQVRELASDCLVESGYTVLVARDGREALTLFREYAEPVNLLLTDVMMPNVNGRQLARELLEQQPDLCILYMSGYTDQLVTEENLTEDEAVLLLKPFTPHQLIAKVREVLDTHIHEMI